MFARSMRLHDLEHASAENYLFENIRGGIFYDVTRVGKGHTLYGLHGDNAIRKMQV